MKIIILGLAFLCFILIGWGIWFLFELPAKAPGYLLSLVLFFVLIAVGEFIAIPISRTVEISLSSVFIFASVLILPLPLIALPIWTGLLISQLSRKKIWFKTFFNASGMSVAAFSASFILELFKLPPINEINLAYFGVALLAAAIYFIINTSLVALVVSLVENLSFVDVWRTWSPSPINIIPFASSILLGLLFAFLYRTNILVAILILPPLVAIYYSFKKNAELQETTRQAVQALANTIDARDSYTFKHSERVAAIAGLVAEKLGLSISEIEIVVTAGRIHDLGKVGVSDQILRRPCKLSDIEWEMIKRHPAQGAEILGALSFFNEEKDIVAAHHEHFNGSGYPDRLEGEDIPLGARILAVADAFDAMRSDRPYRDALSRAETIAVLMEEKHSHFDPEVVEAFLGVLEEHPELDREVIVSN